MKGSFKKSLLLTLLSISLLGLTGAFGAGSTVLLEAENFAEKGGWVVDQQFMDQMGSPYLLAHGLGQPVADAEAKATIAEAGTYYVWVRTFDWVATWDAPGKPGRFQVKINGKALSTEFGTEGAEWHWQAGGTVELAKGPITVVLHDLTGFEGRCDAVVLTKGNTPPANAGLAMAEFRRVALGLPAEPENGGSFDFVVIGGGTAGECAAVVAARLGLKVALVQDRPVLGGNNSSEVRVHLGGTTNHEPYPNVGNVLMELDSGHHGNSGPASYYDDAKKMGVATAEKNLTLFLNYRGNGVKMQGKTIVGVIAQHIENSRRILLTAPLFADCTGDATIGFLAGADFEISTYEHMGRSNLFRVKDMGAPTAFPECPWALDLEDKPIPGGLGAWYWESGFAHDPFEKNEYIRDMNFRAIYGSWDSLKNDRKGHENDALEWIAYIAGKRESRRMIGDVVLTKPELMNKVAYPDGCVPTSWKIDVHIPDERYGKGFKGDEFISKALYTAYDRPYWVPYRCFYSRNISNLFMAGRNVSVTRAALGTVRVMRTTGMMGEVVGMAASLAVKHNTDPRGVYKNHLDDFIALLDAEEAWLDKPGLNLAKAAEVKVSGNYDLKMYPISNLTDGVYLGYKTPDRWVSSAELPNWVEFSWKSNVTLSAARIVSGYKKGEAGIGDSIQTFKLQYHDGSDWKDIPGASAVDNVRVTWKKTFAPVEAKRVRLLVTKTPGNISRIWEVEFFNPKEEN